MVKATRRPQWSRVIVVQLTHFVRRSVALLPYPDVMQSFDCTCAVCSDHDRSGCHKQTITTGSGVHQSCELKNNTQLDYIFPVLEPSCSNLSLTMCVVCLPLGLLDPSSISFLPLFLL